jgi:3-deoxy-7-phosphoheptulonate synthase
MLSRELSPSETGIKTILESRREISRILNKKSKKFIIVVGPCSIHDIDAAKEYAVRLKKLKENCQKTV